jgi:hypothetical protein
MRLSAWGLLAAIAGVLCLTLGTVRGGHAQGQSDFVVQPYYIYPSDQPYHPEYERAVSQLSTEIQQWFAARVGATFRLAPVKVVRAPEANLTIRCGTQPADACRDDRLRRPHWAAALEQAVGGYKPHQIAWIFTQGGGAGGEGPIHNGQATATWYGDYIGVALLGDWTLEGVSGVREPAAITCATPGSFCQAGGPKGAAAHELGHTFGLLHTLHANARSLMNQGLYEYPNSILLPHEIKILRETPWFAANAFDAGAPWLDLYQDREDGIAWGSTWRLTGRGFLPGDEVEFVDETHAVRATPESVTSTALRVRVPQGLQEGYVRVWRGSLRSNVVAANFAPPRPDTVEADGLPPGWDAAPLGTVATLQDKQSVKVANGVWTVSAGGNDLWNDADGGMIAYTRQSGNGSVTARLLSQTGGNSDGWVKTAVGFRESLTANARDLHLSYASAGFLEPAVRVRTGETPKHPGETGSAGVGFYGPDSNQAPGAGRAIGSGIWIGMERNGDVFGYYWSNDGKFWSQVARVTLSLPEQLLAGILASAHKSGEAVPNQISRLDNVTAGPELLAPRSVTDIRYEARNRSVLVTWTPVSVADGEVTYNVYQVGPNGRRLQKMNPVPIRGSSYLVEALTSGTPYRFGVSALVNGGEKPLQLPLPLTSVTPQ